MNEQTLNEIYKKVIHLLETEHLKEALTLIGQMAYGLEDSSMHSVIEETNTTYNYLLQYLKMGVADPERQRQYNKLLCTAFQTADQTYRAQLTTCSNHYYFDRLRHYRHTPLRTIPQLQLEFEAYTEENALSELLNKNTGTNSEQQAMRVRHDQAYEELFYRIWLSGIWTQNEYEEANAFLHSVLVPQNDSALFVSALTLATMQFFDPIKLMTLLDAYEQKEGEVRQRALTGIALIVFLYDKRIMLYSNLKSRLDLLNETPTFIADINRVQIQLLRSRETQKADKKMREEIIPHFMKAIRETKKMDLDDLDEDALHEDFNPEWENWIRKSGIEDKMKELSDMQQEGIDMYLNTFSQLKSFPFFRHIPNWFYPFDSRHAALYEAGLRIDNKNPMQNPLVYAGLFCNSDKYSFSFMIAGLHSLQQEALVQQMFAQTDHIDNGSLMQKLKEAESKPAELCNKYIQDLYRFFKLFPYRTGFKDIFKESLLIYACLSVKSAFVSNEHQRTLADYLFHKGYMSEALPIYQNLAAQKAENAEIQQRIGYCLQQLKEYSQAIKAYLQADAIQPGQLWTHRHLAVCYRLLQQYPQALAYYRKVEEAEPDNLKILMQIGFCLIQSHNYEEALPYFFKVDYLNPSSAKARRSIAWCSFLCRKYEQARKYYTKLVEEKPQAEDLLNIGHVTWVSESLEKAVPYYLRSLQLSENAPAFFQNFSHDKNVLIQAGIPANEITLVQDLIRYEAEK